MSHQSDGVQKVSGAAEERKDSPPATSRNGMRLLVLVVLNAVIFGLCILIAYPFLAALTWGIALAIMAWPMHRWISRQLHRPAVSAAVTTLIVVGVILGAGIFLTYNLARETGAATEHYQETTAERGLRERLDDVPLVSGGINWMGRFGVDIEAEVRKFMAANAQGVFGFAQSSITAAIQFLVAVFILFYVLLDRFDFLHNLRDLLPLSRAESDSVMSRAADSVHANLYATVITSLIDAVGGGLLFWSLGLPAPVLWASAMFILALLPIVGAAFVWFPTAVYLALTGRMFAAGALLVWGLVTFVVVDNFLYVRLAGERMRMHPVAAMIAFLGGIAVFGISGMILGPAIISIAGAFLDVWKQRIAEDGNPATPAVCSPDNVANQAADAAVASN